jgi:hypothetical protein
MAVYKCLQPSNDKGLIGCKACRKALRRLCARGGQPGYAWLFYSQAAFPQVVARAYRQASGGVIHRLYRGLAACRVNQ